MEKSIHNIIAHMVANDIEYKDLSGNGVLLLQGDFNLTDKQMRSLIVQAYKNDFAVCFENKKFYVQKPDYIS